MAKYSNELVEKITNLMEEDSYTISEICDMLSISRKTFYEWKDEKPEFREALQKAKENCDAQMLKLARRSLKRKLEGYTLTETRTTFIPDEDDPSKMILKNKVVKSKEYPPDIHAVKYVLKHNDDNFKEEDPIQRNVFNITVQDQQTADQLRILRSDKPEKGNRKPLPETDEADEADEMDEMDEMNKDMNISSVVSNISEKENLPEPLKEEPEPKPEPKPEPIVCDSYPPGWEPGGERRRW